MEQPNDRDKLSLAPNIAPPVILPQHRGPVLVKMREYKTPVHETFRCWRYVAATPNMADKTRDDPKPLFASPYLILESSDIVSELEIEWQWLRFCKKLLDMGFESIVVVG